MTIEQNPQLPAQRLIPIMKPLEKLLEKWEIKPLEKVGSQVNYNPQFHQLMEGIAQEGDRVKVRYVGYIQRDKLLYRAKVSPIN
jgi:molecular chaperone GrpE (heat shock protein)